jgi:flagellar biogenesis protein FliO
MFMWISSLALGPASLGLGEMPFLRMALALLCTFAIAIIALLALRSGWMVQRQGSKLLKVEMQAELSATHTVYLVRAAGRYLLLGGTATSLSLLAEIDEDQAREALSQKDEVPAPRPSFFRALLGSTGKP